MTKDQIIVPLDVSNFDAAKRLVEKLPQVGFWKVGLQLFVGAGPQVLEYLKQQDKQIFLDLKFHDIPNTMAGACQSVLQYGVDLVTLHSSAGKEALAAAMAAVADANPRPRLIGISLLTSINSRELAYELKIPLELPQYALEMALLSQEAGLDGAVCSPHEVAQMRQVCGKDFVLVCPGVRPQWSASGDQKRVMTPTQAIQAGADYLVIGRPITAAEDPQAAWNRIVEELATP